MAFPACFGAHHSPATGAPTGDLIGEPPPSASPVDVEFRTPKIAIERPASERNAAMTTEVLTYVHQVCVASWSSPAKSAETGTGPTQPSFAKRRDWLIRLSRTARPFASSSCQHPSDHQGDMMDTTNRLTCSDLFQP